MGKHIRAHGRSVWREIWGWIWPIAVGVGVAKAILVWVFSFALVPSGSMSPTIPNPCYIFVDHLATEFSAPYRTEVVLFPFPDDPTRTFVKRIIGMPGDKVYITGGHVYINNKILNEPYLREPTLGTYGPWKVPANSYFMLGDHRSNSLDSRFWNHPFVKGSTMMGRADFVVWPLAKAEAIH